MLKLLCKEVLIKKMYMLPSVLAAELNVIQCVMKMLMKTSVIIWNK